MDREALVARQQPLKEQYRQEPATALVTLRAEGTPDREEVSCSVDTGRATPDELATLIRLTERYCVVYQTLVRPLPISVE